MLAAVAVAVAAVAVAVAAGVVVGGVAVATGGAGVPIAMSTLASAAAAVGVVSLWRAGYDGIRLMLDLVRIGLDVDRTPSSDCATLGALATRLGERVIAAAPAVIEGVLGAGVVRIARRLRRVFDDLSTRGLCSFAGDTRVLTERGHRPIRAIVPGRDGVWAREEGTGRAGWWVDAEHLVVGDALLGADGGWQEVVSVRVAERALEAWNLTVEGYHTYFVGGGDAGEGRAKGDGTRPAAVWVHKSGG